MIASIRMGDVADFRFAHEFAIGADDVVAVFCKTGPGYQPDVAAANHRNFHPFGSLRAYKTLKASTAKKTVSMC